MSKAVIWDLDGTLLDSYDVIVESLYLALREQNVVLPKEEIHRYAIEFSIKSLFARAEERYGCDVELLQQRYTQISGSKYLDIRLMEGALETLAGLENAGAKHYVFTHRGKTTIPVLNNLQITGFFREILTSQSGFKRKPDPEALLYLMDKYNMDPANTYYVGDRSLDMECAKNAGIQGILYQKPDSMDVSGAGECYCVSDLRDILNIV